MEKGKGRFLSEWFHISPWEVPNFRIFLVNILTQSEQWQLIKYLRFRPKKISKFNYEHRTPDLF